MCTELKTTQLTVFSCVSELRVHLLLLGSQKINTKLGIVVHTYNPSYLESRGRRIQVQVQTGQN
jgi:hypothetical protein